MRGEGFEPFRSESAFWFSESRTPTGQEPQSCAFDLAGRPPHHRAMMTLADLMIAAKSQPEFAADLK